MSLQRSLFLICVTSITVSATESLLPYPHSSTSLEDSSVLFAVATDNLACFSDIVTTESLSGVLARDNPQVYTVGSTTDPDSGNDAAFWLSQLVIQSSIIIDETYLDDLPGLLTHFASNVDGYIKYTFQNESNAALTLASGTEGNVIVATDDCGTASLLDELGIPVVGDASNLDSLGALHKVGLQPYSSSSSSSSLLSTRMVSFAPNDGSKASCLASYSLFGRMATTEFSYNSDDITEAWGALLASLNPNTLNAGMGWFTGGDEYGYVSTLAMEGSAWSHASDWSTNLDSFSNQLKTLSNLATHSSMERLDHKHIISKKKNNGRETKKDVNSMKHTVSFVMSDGDNICWLQGGWRGSSWFGAPERLQDEGVPIGWTFSPAAAELLPVVLSYAQSNSTSNDTLIAGPSGAGYTYPGIFYKGEEDDFIGGSTDVSNRSTMYASATAALMEEAQMSLLTVIDGAPSVEVVAPLVSQSAIDAVILLTYNDGYSGLRGNVAYVDGKLVIGGRVSLWDEAESGDMVGVSGLVNTLQTLPKDPSDPNSYSLIPVHAWSHNYSDVVEAARELAQAGGFEVLRPDEFVQKLVRNTGGQETCPLPSGPWGASCVNCVLSGNGTCVFSCSCSPTTENNIMATTSTVSPESVKIKDENKAYLKDVTATCDLSVCHENLYIDSDGLFCCEDGSHC